MKQRIKTEQLSELSGEGKENLTNYCKRKDLLYNKHKYCVEKTFEHNGSYWCKDCDEIIDWDEKTELPLLSIGEMIEFLDDSGYSLYSINTIEQEGKRIAFMVTFRDQSFKHTLFGNRPELCDALFEAVKEVLEK